MNPECGTKCDAERGSMARFYCVDCNINTAYLGEYYAVYDDVWHLAGDVDGMLCIGCLEKRLSEALGQSFELSGKWFPMLPINFDSDIWQSTRLLSRMSGFVPLNPKPIATVWWGS